MNNRSQKLKFIIWETICQNEKYTIDKLNDEKIDNAFNVCNVKVYKMAITTEHF